MAEVVLQGDIFNKVGCTDTLATNYDPTAVTPCVDCCIYGTVTYGCTDPLAVNYNPNAETCTDSLGNLNGCCEYFLADVNVTNGETGPTTGEPIGIDAIPPPSLGTVGTTTTTTTTTTGTIGTTGIVTGIIGDIRFNVGTVGTLGTGVGNTTCVGPYTITIDNQVLGVEGVECCSQNNTQLGPAPAGFQYYWDGKNCTIIPTCPINTTCVDCTNFNWWNNTYISNHNGQNLSVSSPILWQQIVDLVTNSGQTISVNTLNGELISESCCEGVFKNGICFCEQAAEETYEPRCIATLNDFLNLISTTVGYNFFINNFSTIGPSLGLTTTQINFIKLNINSTNIQNLTSARTILLNALDVTGGFYVNFGTLTNTPILVTKGVCDQYGGYWDSNTGSGNNTGTIGGSQLLGPTPSGTIDLGGTQVGTTLLRTVGEVVNLPIESTNGNCMCKPVVNQCEIDLSQVQTISSFDFFNNPIQIVVLKEGNVPLNEACCNRIIKDNPNLGWEWQSPYCLSSPREDCLPAIFELNNNTLMEVPPCENDLELSMWLYFAKPKNPCQVIPDPPDNDIIVIDGAFCDITLTPNTGAVQVTNNSTNIDIGTSLINGINANNTTTPIEAQPKTGGTCCYNINNPILARVSTTDPTLNQFLTQVKIYNSSTDYFDTWVQIKATLPTSGLTLNFGLNLEIYQGLNCCCDYDFFVDDIQVNCVGQVPSLIYNDIQCPGFNLNRVIDNKKSWVYNPGLPSVGISEYDNIERIDGDFGMLNGEGSINRTFAPSLDASIPWRYTDYWNQSSVYENHSNLVLNSKELWLTYDMCADCPISGTTLACPSGYTLSANTSVCYQESYCFNHFISNNTGSACTITYLDCDGILNGLSLGDGLVTNRCGLSFTACTGVLIIPTTVCSAFTYTTTATTVNTVTYLSLYDLENYKKQFQSFWIPFMEQFIPATTIWVAGERWCNEVCTIINPCDYDFELVEAEVSIQEIPPGFFPAPPRSYTNSGFVGLVATTNTNTNLPSGTATATQPTSSSTITPVVDLGLTTTTPIVRTVAQASIDIVAYRNRFTAPTIETIIL